MADAIDALSVLRSAFDAVSGIRPYTDRSIDEGLYKLHRADVFRINVFLYDMHVALRARAVLPQKDMYYLIVSVQAYARYLQCVYGPEVRDEMLSFIPPQQRTASPLLWLVRSLACLSGQVRVELEVDAMVNVLVAARPAFAQFVATMRTVPPKRRAVKDRHCGYPGCPVTGKERCYNNMKKCSRCRAVYYCSRDHHQQHWRLGHRFECVPLRYQYRLG